MVNSACPEGRISLTPSILRRAVGLKTASPHRERRKLITAEIVLEIRDMLAGLHSPDDIAEKLGISPYLIPIVSWAASHPDRGVIRWTRLQDETLIGLVVSGASRAECMASLGKSYCSVSSRLKKLRRKFPEKVPNFRGAS